MATSLQPAVTLLRRSAAATGWPTKNGPDAIVPPSLEGPACCTSAKSSCCGGLACWTREAALATRARRARAVQSLVLPPRSR